MLLYFYMIVSLAVDLLLSFGLRLVTDIWDIWIVIVLFVGVLMGIFILHLLGICIISLFIDKKKQPEKLDTIYRKAAVSTLDIVIRVLGIRLHINGMDKMPKEPYLLISNHRSLIDSVINVVVFNKDRLAFISKKENIKLPLIGRYLIAVGCLSLDREDARAAVKTINTAAEVIKSGKGSIAICPEGTRNRTEDLLLPFHAGSFKIAQKAKSPIVVTTIYGTHKVGIKSFFCRADIYLDIIGVIPVERVMALKSSELCDEAYGMMLENLGGYVK